ncbi:MAG: Uma2 family endonuclease [Archangium sp.]|nr:Uma2 family endonuclease [Archangium sp.]
MLQSAHDTIDQRIFFNFDWDEFQRFLEIRSERRGNRITYLDGVLEIMSPSHMHEGIKSRIGRLLELWATFEEVDLSSWGSTTLKKKRSKVGAEPDECYVVGRAEWPGRPDLAIEVSWTSGGIDKLEVYDRLEVPEVWFWEDDRLTIHVRKPRGGYAKRKKSALFPTLDIETFSAHAADPDQPRAVRTFLAALRKN